METAFRLIRILTLFTILCANGAFGASEEPMMKAVVAHEYGAPEVTEVRRSAAAGAEGR